MKLSFKKHPRETGLRSVGNPNADVSIKADGSFVGLIDAPNWQTEDGKYRVKFTISDDKGAGWKWAVAKARFDNEDAAREWVKTKWEVLCKTWNLHPVPDYKPWEN